MANQKSRSDEKPDDVITSLTRRYGEKYPGVDNLAIEFHLRMAAAAAARSSASARFFRSRGMERTAGRYGVLRVLFFAPEKRMALSDVSSDMGVTAANMTALVDGLEKDGLVVRVPHPTDRRITWVRLTPRGEEVCVDLVPAMANLMAQLTKGFSEDEKSSLIDAMKRLRENAEAGFREE